MAERRKQ